MHSLWFASLMCDNKKKQTRREKFLQEMDIVIDRSVVCLKQENGRKRS